MRFQDQKDSTDCFQTTIANLLGIDIERIPKLEASTAYGQIRELNKFLHPFGLAFVLSAIDNEDLRHTGISGLWHEMRGRTVRNTSHSVLARDEHIVHDPHPSHAGLSEHWSSHGVIVLLRPWEFFKKVMYDQFP
jgi:hypothetical protein